jgi:hypothetical protein
VVLYYDVYLSGALGQQHRHARIINSATGGVLFTAGSPRELGGGGLLPAGGMLPHSCVFLQAPVTAVLQGARSTTAAQSWAWTESLSGVLPEHAGYNTLDQNSLSRWYGKARQTIFGHFSHSLHVSCLETKSSGPFQNMLHMTRCCHSPSRGRCSCRPVVSCSCSNQPAHQSPVSGLQVDLGAVGLGCKTNAAAAAACQHLTAKTDARGCRGCVAHQHSTESAATWAKAQEGSRYQQIHMVTVW